MLERGGRWLAAVATLGACSVNEPPPPERREESAPGVADHAPAAPPQTSTREGLAKFAAEEDSVRKALVDAHSAKNKADEASCTAAYKKLLAESDAYTAMVVTPEFIASVPWTDALAPEMASRWSKSASVPGFACRIENGVLATSSPDPGCKQQGVVGFLDQPTDDLRHFVLDMEFAVEGMVTMLFHVAAPPALPDNRLSHSYDLVANENGLKANKKYNLHATYVGSTLSITFLPIGDEDPIAPWSPDPSWVKLRRGGIAFLVPEGARLKVTRMRIKELR